MTDQREALMSLWLREYGLPGALRLALQSGIPADWLTSWLRSQST